MLFKLRVDLAILFIFPFALLALSYESNLISDTKPYNTHHLTSAERICLAVQIESAIRDGNVQFADEKLTQLAADEASEIHLIVRDLYETNKSHFAMINDYAWNSSQYYISHRILMDYWKMIKDKDEDNFLELCDFYKNLESKVKRPPMKVPGHLIEDTKFMLKNEIGPRIINYAAPILKNSLIRKTDLDVMVEIGNKLYFTNESLFDRTLCLVINETYHDTSFRQILHFVRLFKSPAQRASGLTCLFWQLYPKIENNPQSTMLIAYYMHKLLKKNESTFEASLPPHKLNAILNCIAKLPATVKALYFHNGDLAFRNTVYGEYLSVHSEKFDNYRHRVVQERRYLPYDNERWQAIPVGEFVFLFRNKKHQNEFLYTDEEHLGLLDVYYRQVFTWIASEDSKYTKLYWRVRFHGKREISIATTAHDDAEYLCLNENYNEAFTTTFDKNQCRWYVDVLH